MCPNIGTLKSSSTRVVVGVGVGSEPLITYRTSLALAELLDTEPVGFPGDHGGFLAVPEKFADRSEVLRG